MSSCTQINRTIESFIPEKAIGAFYINFNKIIVLDGQLPNSIFESYYKPFMDKANEIGINLKQIVEIYGFILPYQKTELNMPFAIALKLKGYDPVVFNQFTLRNANFAKLPYKDITYFYDKKNRLAIYAKSPTKIYIANSTLSMDELIELSYKNYKELRTNSLTQFLEKNHNKAGAFKFFIPEDLLKAKPLLNKIKAVDFALDFRTRFDAIVNIFTDDIDFADSIASIIDGVIKTTYGLSKLTSTFPEEIEDIYKDFTPELKNDIITFSKLLNNFNVKANSGNIKVEITLDFLLLKKIIESWSTIK